MEGGVRRTREVRKVELGKDREGEQGKDTYDRGSYYRLNEKPGTRELSRNPQG